MSPVTFVKETLFLASSFLNNKEIGRSGPCYLEGGQFTGDGHRAQKVWCVVRVSWRAAAWT